MNRGSTEKQRRVEKQSKTLKVKIAGEKIVFFE
jgi:hypothetical protein